MENTEATSVMQRLHFLKQHNQIFDTPISSSSRIEAPMRQSFQNFTRENSKKKPPHFPDSSRYSQITVPQSASQRLGNQIFNPPAPAPSHSRSLSQSPFFTLDNCLPPLSPLPHCRISADVSMEEKSANSHTSGNNTFGATENSPSQTGHRRSNSDVPLGFSDMIQSSLQLIPIRSHMGADEEDKKKPIQLVKQELDCNNSAERVESEGEVVDDLLNAYMNLDNIDTLNSSAAEDKDRDSRASGTKTNVGDSSDNEVESSINGITNSMLGTRLSFPAEKKEGVKRSAGGEIAPTSRHCRSVSMDSFMGDLHFGDESPKIPPSIDGNSTKFSLEFGSGEFSGAELRKIMANEKLAEIASSDPKRVKRILANRQSAARSKERKLRYISELEYKVQTLQTEATTLSAQLTLLQRDTAGLTSQNNELKFRFQAMEQQAQLRDALHDALTMEVQRLKLTAAELNRETHPSNSMALQLSIDHHHAYQLQHQQPTQLNIYQLQQQQRQQHQQRQQEQHNHLQSLQQNGDAAKHESNK